MHLSLEESFSQWELSAGEVPDYQQLAPKCHLLILGWFKIFMVQKSQLFCWNSLTLLGKHLLSVYWSKWDVFFKPSSHITCWHGNLLASQLDGSEQLIMNNGNTARAVNQTGLFIIPPRLFVLPLTFYNQYPWQEKHNTARHTYILDFRGKKNTVSRRSGLEQSRFFILHSAVYTRLVYPLKQA